MQKATESDNQSDILVKLGDGNLVLSNPEDDLTHHSVIDSNGKEIGRVSALFVDKAEQKVRFLQVSKGGLFGLGVGQQQFLIPAEDVVRKSSDSVYINHSLEHLINSPPYDPKLTTVHDTNFWYPFYDFYKLAPYWV